MIEDHTTEEEEEEFNQTITYTTNDRTITYITTLRPKNCVILQPKIILGKKKKKFVPPKINVPNKKIKVLLNPVLLLLLLLTVIQRILRILLLLLTLLFNLVLPRRPISYLSRLP